MARTSKMPTETANAFMPEKLDGASTKKKNLTGIVIFVLSILLAMALGIAGYFYYQYIHNSQQNTELSEVETIARKIGAFMELPEGEVTLATVTDKTKLADQAFFKKAENGDKILIYTSGGKAILYRPSQNKVIDVTAINVQNNTPANESSNVSPKNDAETEPVNTEAMQSTNESPTPTEAMVSPTIALYNGSTKIGVTNKMEDQVVTAFPSVVVEKKEKATKNDYQGNLIIDLSGKNAELVQKIADAVSGTVTTTLPDGETNPNTDVLIIVGNK